MGHMTNRVKVLFFLGSNYWDRQFYFLVQSHTRLEKYFHGRVTAGLSGKNANLSPVDLAAASDCWAWQQEEAFLNMSMIYNYSLVDLGLELYFHALGGLD